MEQVKFLGLVHTFTVKSHLSNICTYLNHQSNDIHRYLACFKRKVFCFVLFCILCHTHSRMFGDVVGCRVLKQDWMTPGCPLSPVTKQLEGYVGVVWIKVLISVFISRGSPEHANFWNFFQRYRQFQSRHRPPQKHKQEHGKNHVWKDGVTRDVSWP